MTKENEKMDEFKKSIMEDFLQDAAQSTSQENGGSNDELEQTGEPLRVYLLIDDQENLNRISTNKASAYENAREHLKVVEIELREVDEVREEHYSKYTYFCKICYDGEDYWFNAHDYGAAVVELYLMLNRPEDFLRKVKNIYEYFIGENSLKEDIAMKGGWGRGFEKPDIYQLSVLAENVLKCLNDWNRDLCALAISSIPEDVATKEKLKEGQLYSCQSFLNSKDAFGDFKETDLQSIKKILNRTNDYFSIIEPNCMSFDFLRFHGGWTEETDKMKYLFWGFIYQSCSSATLLSYLLYQCITEDLFSSMADEYMAKREYFKDWKKQWSVDNNSSILVE